uniref:RRM domain-containing protein n=1 Tax=Panagrolaimus davidi TaxID=227884 RepID=A0A914PC36_9BILA
MGYSRSASPRRSRSRSPRRSPAPRYDRSRSPRDRRSPPRYERSSRGDYRNGGDRGGDRYRDSGRRGGYDDRRGGGGPRNNSARENPRPSNCLGVFGMSNNTTEHDLREIFERYGRVDSVKVIMDRETGRSRGFGFVNFEERSEATRAREKISDTVIDGMKVRVDYAIQNRRSSPTRNRSPGARRRSPPPARRYSRSPSR